MEKDNMFMQYENLETYRGRTLSWVKIATPNAYLHILRTVLLMAYDISSHFLQEKTTANQ